ncbi:hypothetical protein JMJ35_009282, partial [Cladonia borealis]
MAAKTILHSSWKENLQAHRDNIFFALSTENLTYTHMRSALAVQQASNTSLQLKAAAASFEGLKEEVDSLKNSKPDEPAWKAKLDAKRQEMRQKSNDAIGASFDAAADYIQELTKEQQEPTLDVFNGLTNLIAKAAEFVFRKIKELMESLVDFLRGIWDKVVTTYNSVKSFISNAISGLIGQREKLEAIQLSTRESGVFEGSITFPGSVSLGQAATMVDTTCGVLD